VSFLVPVRQLAALESADASRSKMLFGEPATADESEIGSLGARVEPSDRFRDPPEHYEPQKDPSAGHKCSLLDRIP
jgi:hypothetical protein